MQKTKTREISLENLCDTLGINVDETILKPTDSFDGLYLAWAKEQVRCILLNPALDEEKRRFVLAHEVGHAMLGAYSRNSSEDKIKQCEMEANVFAAVLMALMALCENREGLSCSQKG